MGKTTILKNINQGKYSTATVFGKMFFTAAEGQHQK